MSQLWNRNVVQYLLFEAICLTSTLPIPVPLVTLRAAVGDRVQLNCTTRLTVHVYWSYIRSLADNELTDVFVDGAFVNGFGQKYQMDYTGEFTYNLIIPSASLSDSGIFICKENGGVGEALTRVNLTVSRSQSFQMVPNGLVVVEEGRELLIECVTGLAAPVDLHFYPEGSDMLHYRDIFAENRLIYTFNGRVSFSHDSNTGKYQFALHDVTASANMTGTFECSENGGVGPGKDRVEVIIVNAARRLPIDDRTRAYTSRAVETTVGSTSDSDDDSDSQTLSQIWLIPVVINVVLLGIAVTVFVRCYIKRRASKTTIRKQLFKKVMNLISARQSSPELLRRSKQPSVTLGNDSAVPGHELPTVDSTVSRMSTSSMEGAPMLCVTDVTDSVNGALTTSH